MRPAGSHVLIKPLDDEIMYAGRIHLPDTAKAKAQDGMVVSVGEWCEHVRPGDWCVYSRKQATDVEIDGVAHIIINERAIVLILEDEEGDDEEII